jgi:hypothetical protein
LSNITGLAADQIIASLILTADSHQLRIGTETVRRNRAGLAWLRIGVEKWMKPPFKFVM